MPPPFFSPDRPGSMKEVRRMAQATIQINGAVATVQLASKQFKTGSTGYHGFGKVEVAGDGKYQINVLAVKIGSGSKKNK